MVIRKKVQIDNEEGSNEHTTVPKGVTRKTRTIVVN
jgi:hypothetical protein